MGTKYRKNTHFKLDMLILAILMKEDCYGYMITQKIKELSNGLIQIQEGTLYPVLYKMLDDHFVTQYEKKGGKRQIRIYYHIEEKGIENFYQLVKEYKRWDRQVKNIIKYGEKKDSQ